MDWILTLLNITRINIENNVVNYNAFVTVLFIDVVVTMGAYRYIVNVIKDNTFDDYIGWPIMRITILGPIVLCFDIFNLVAVFATWPLLAESRSQVNNPFWINIITCIKATYIDPNMIAMGCVAVLFSLAIGIIVSLIELACIKRSTTN